MKATYGARRTGIAKYQRQPIAFSFFEGIRYTLGVPACHNESRIYTIFSRNKARQPPTRPIFMLNTIGNNVKNTSSYLI
ncbi:MAG: hypothetical protein P8J27_09370 [Mariniblastus sp.]|nr:hypothetical protein [Mariniblastus sp.]